MKPKLLFLLVFLLACVVGLVAAQLADGKQGKGNSKHDEYMINESYLTKPKTADSKGVKGSGKTFKHHIERIKGGKQNGHAHTVSPDAMPEPKRSQLQHGSATTEHSTESHGSLSGTSQNNEGSGKATSDLSGKRIHKPLTMTHRRK